MVLGAAAGTGAGDSVDSVSARGVVLADLARWPCSKSFRDPSRAQAEVKAAQFHEEQRLLKDDKYREAKLQEKIRQEAEKAETVQVRAGV